MASKPIVAPYIEAKLGTKGVPQMLVGRALARAGFGKLYYATRGRRKWDASLTSRLNEWRASVEIDTREPRYTREDHLKLARWWDAYNVKQAHIHLATISASTREARYRAAVVAKCAYLLNMSARLAYTQARPYDRRDVPRGLDCSGSSAWVEEKAGGKPMGTPFGTGNTWTQLAWFRSVGRMLVHDRRPFVKVAKAADRIFYGTSVLNSTHTGIYLGVGSDGVDRSFQFGRYPCRVDKVDYRGDRVAIVSAWPLAV